MSLTDNGERNNLRAARPSFFERLRGFLGLTQGSVRNDIEDALEDMNGAEFTAQERTILKNVLSLHEHQVNDVKVPRADIVAVSMESTLAEVLTLFRSAGHSRLPVFGDNLDDVRGMVHIRDFVDHLASAVENSGSRKRALSPADETAKAEHNNIGLIRRAVYGGLNLNTRLAQANIIRPVLFVPPSMPALDVLLKMQAKRTHMALVIDEYGGTDGLVSIEDIVETIVGDIEDEHDEDAAPVIEKIAEGLVIAEGRADLREFLEVIGIESDGLEDLDDIDTLGGLVTSSVGYVPARGEIVKVLGLEVEVLDADPRRIKRVRVRFKTPEQMSSDQKPESDKSKNSA